MEKEMFHIRLIAFVFIKKYFLHLDEFPKKNIANGFSPNVEFKKLYYFLWLRDK